MESSDFSQSQAGQPTTSARPPSPEIIVALVGAVGSDLDAVTDRIEISLSRFGYGCHRVRVSRLFSALLGGSPPDPEDERIEAGMNEGTKLRKDLSRGDATIGLAIQGIARIRNGDLPLERTAYVVRSLKHPAEVTRLRAIYRSHFVCIGVYAPRHTRVSQLAEQIAHSRGQRTAEWRATAERLVQKDEKELGTRLGQNVRDTFPLADFFVNAADTNRLGATIDRLWDLFFGRPFLSPTRDEFGMFHATAAALRSAALSRQVGAAVCTREGDVLAVGMNEVPKAGGGHYWCDDDGDMRDFNRGHDQNDRTKRTMAREVLAHLKSNGWLSENFAAKSADELLDLTMRGAGALFRDTIFAGLTEFGREVHAEMSAITSAARLGVAAAGTVMYVTTFPCHNCAKHIISSGVARVVYVEPYPKSFAADFHEDSMTMDASDHDCGRSVGFQAFQGVAPRRYIEWFQWGDRKDDGGKALGWEPARAAPRFAELNFDPLYRDREDHYLKEFNRELVAAGLAAAPATG